MTTRPTITMPAWTDSGARENTSRTMRGASGPHVRGPTWPGVKTAAPTVPRARHHYTIVVDNLGPNPQRPGALDVWALVIRVVPVATMQGSASKAVTRLSNPHRNWAMAWARKRPDRVVRPSIAKMVAYQHCTGVPTT